jgi:hypothetical protein
MSRSFATNALKMIIYYWKDSAGIGKEKRGTTIVLL